jgi:sporulation protein YlmC with PRC-barrel domain
MTLGGALAQDGAAPAVQMGDTDVMGSELIGADIHAADYEGDAQTYDQSGSAEWDAIGEIDDLLITRDGSVKAVLVDVGGFLGMGEKTVAIPMDEISFLEGDGGMADWRLAVDRSRESLESAPAFEPAEEGMNDASARDPSTQMAQSNDPAVQNDASPGTAGSGSAGSGGMAPMIEREGWRAAEGAEVEKLTAEDLEGVGVYGVDDEEIGEIEDLVVTPDGKIQSAVLEVGGFLGIGEKEVEMPFDQVRLMRQADGDDWRAYVDRSLEDLKGMPSYED